MSNVNYNKKNKFILKLNNFNPWRQPKKTAKAIILQLSYAFSYNKLIYTCSCYLERKKYFVAVEKNGFISPYKRNHFKKA